MKSVKLKSYLNYFGSVTKLLLVKSIWELSIAQNSTVV